MGENSKIEWWETRDVPGHPGYRVTTMGDVSSCWCRRGLGRGRGTLSVMSGDWRQLRKNRDARGYYVVSLGRGKKRSVHHLVLEAFCGPRPGGMECRHLNGDPLDNRLENLRWGTPAENAADQYAHGTRVAGGRHPMAKLSTDQVRAIRQLYAAGGWNQYELADLFGVQQPVVSSIINLHHRVTAASEVA